MTGLLSSSIMKFVYRILPQSCSQCPFAIVWLAVLWADMFTEFLINIVDKYSKISSSPNFMAYTLEGGINPHIMLYYVYRRNKQIIVFIEGKNWL